MHLNSSGTDAIHYLHHAPSAWGCPLAGFTQRAVLRGARVEGRVLLNTLREINARIDWVNTAMARVVGHGGMGLFLDALFLLLVNAGCAAQARQFPERGLHAAAARAWPHEPYAQCRHSDWSLDCNALGLPVQVITGLQGCVFPGMDVVDRLFARLPDARREDWAEIGHLLPQEAPGRLAASLARFGGEMSA